MNAIVIDAFDFSRREERREGDVMVADLPRLAAELANGSGVLHWTLQGAADRLGHAQLALSVTGAVQLQCQRCLTLFAFDIVSESVLVLAKDESSADEIDALLDDDAVDVIVASCVFDVIQLIEDEALLALPLAPKHDTCPDQAILDALKGARKESPFAVLKNLK